MAIALPRAETETGRKLEGGTNGGRVWKHAATSLDDNPLDSLRPSLHTCFDACCRSFHGLHQPTMHRLHA
jgi:hypothetical protein